MPSGRADFRPFHGTFEHQDWETLAAEGQNNPVWDQDGKYEVTYVVTRSAEFQHTVKEADTAGTGLFGAYFVGKHLDQGGLLGTQQDPELDFNWDPEYGPVETDVELGEDGCWSARWTGYVEPLYSEVYTFGVYTDGGVRVWVDQQLVIDEWASVSEGEQVGTVLLVGAVLYDIQVDYLPGLYEKKLQLSWASVSQAKETISSSALRTAANLLAGGSNRLYVLPTVVCASSSAIAGPGLSIATAGISASFTVWSKDMYGNLRDDALDFFQARIVPDAPETGVVYAGTGSATLPLADALAVALTSCENAAVFFWSMCRTGLTESHSRPCCDPQHLSDRGKWCGCRPVLPGTDVVDCAESRLAGNLLRLPRVRQSSARSRIRKLHRLQRQEQPGPVSLQRRQRRRQPGEQRDVERALGRLGPAVDV